MYGRIEDGALTIAPKGETEGYFPVRYTTPPEPKEGGYWEAEWEQKDGEIVQVWVWVDLSKPSDEVGKDEAFEIIFGGEQ